MTIDISQYFEHVNDKSWLDLAMKSLKIEDTVQFEKKLNFKTCEGPVLKSNYSAKETNSITLTSFPKKRELIFSNSVLKASSLKELKSMTGKEDSYLDLFQFCLNENDQIEDLTEYLKNNKVNVLISSSIIHNAGASIVQELSLILSLLKFNKEELGNESDLVIEVPLDSLYFNNIAKLRGIRYLAESLQEQCGINHFEIYATSSNREQTLYDPWMNMLRNTTSCASAFIGGANKIKVNSYDDVVGLYSKYEATELGKRQSRNIFHILNEESFLSQVEDPSAGSYIIEDLTREYIDTSFDMFKRLERDGGVTKCLNKFALEVELIAKERFKRAANVSTNIAGINNFANTDESLEQLYKVKIDFNSENSLFPLRRTSTDFEVLRNKLEDTKLNITILAYGPETKISARVMFCVNYFEVLGHKCEIEYYSESSKTDFSKCDAVVLCSLDEMYGELMEIVKSSSNQLSINTPLFIAGNKFKHEGIQNIFMGQDILDVLSQSFLKETK